MHVTKVFTNGNSQAVRLPKEFRLKRKEVFIRRDVATGDIVLSEKPPSSSWAEFFALRKKYPVPADFMAERPLNIPNAVRDPFAAPDKAARIPPMRSRQKNSGR